MKSRLKCSFTTYPLIWILACIFIIPILIIALAFLITTQSFGDMLSWFSTHFEPFILEYLVILFSCALFYAAAGKLWVSALVPGVLLFALTLVSYYKTSINGTPLLLSDFSLASQFSEITRFALPQITVSFCTAAALIIFVLLCVLLYLLDKRLGKVRWLRMATALSACVFAVIFFFTPAFTTWAAALDSAPLSQDERVVEYGAVLGLYASYAHDLTYDAEALDTDQLLEQIETIIEAEPEPSPEATPEPEIVEEPHQLPTVIFLMSESFFDVTKLPEVTFSEDPIPVFHSLAEEYTSGSFMSSTYCGGTGWVEMEVLTAISGHYLKESDTLTSLPDDTYAGMPAITDVFKAYGYSTTFLHSYTPSLYNRELIYTQFGFDKIMFNDSFDEEAEMRGGYISDMELSKKIISLYEENTEQPAFMYAVSMENHQPYNGAKFADGSLIGIESEILSEEEQEVLEAYATGLNDADRALGYLVDYFSAREEPVMIVFFGDHLPNLGLAGGETIYSRLGYSSTAVTTDWQPDELSRMLSTDYLIWTNYESEPLPDRTESCTFLGVSVLNRLKFDLGNYYSWLDRHIIPKLLLYRPRLFVDGQGVAYSDIPEEYEIAMNGYGASIYNIAYGDQQIFPTSRNGGS